jgi:hypothetical protein
MGRELTPIECHIKILPPNSALLLGLPSYLGTCPPKRQKASELILRYNPEAHSLHRRYRKNIKPQNSQISVL